MPAALVRVYVKKNGDGNYVATSPDLVGMSEASSTFNGALTAAATYAAAVSFVVDPHFPTEDDASMFRDEGGYIHCVIDKAVMALPS